MRLLFRSVFLLLVAASTLALAQDTSPRMPAPATRGEVTQNADGNFQFRVVPRDANTARDFSASPKKEKSASRKIKVFTVRGDGTCYYIHAFYRQRVDGTGVTVPAGESVCTPSSRLQMKKADRARVLPAIEH